MVVSAQRGQTIHHLNLDYMISSEILIMFIFEEPYLPKEDKLFIILTLMT